MTEGPERELTLTQLLATRIRTADGRSLGRLRDLRIERLAPGSPVDRVLLGAGRGDRYVLPWSMLDLTPDDSVASTLRLRSEEIGSHHVRDDEPARPGSGAVWLGRDVLDSQVVDLSGSRLSRVSEVLLRVDHHGAPVPIAVDLGVGALMARIGLRAAARHLPRVIVPWDDLYLASAGGHRSELAVSTDRLGRRDASVVAEIIARLPLRRSAEVLQAVPSSRAATALTASNRALRQRLVRLLPARRSEAPVVAHDPDSVTDGRRLLRTAGWRVPRPRRTSR